MHNCEYCPNKLCLETGRSCKDMEKKLLKDGIRGFGARLESVVATKISEPDATMFVP